MVLTVCPAATVVKVDGEVAWAVHPLGTVSVKVTSRSGRAPAGLGSVVLRDQIYTYGGERASHAGDAGVFPNHERYDPASDHWASLPPLPTPRHGLGVAAVNGKIYIIGGGPRTGFSQTDVVEVYTP